MGWNLEICALPLKDCSGSRNAGVPPTLYTAEPAALVGILVNRPSKEKKRKRKDYAGSESTTYMN